MYIRATICVVLLLGSGRAIAQPPLDALRDITSSLESAIRSQSQASNRPSMALIDRETARSMNYDNQLKHVTTYFEKRKLNRMYREAEHRPRRTQEQIDAQARRTAPDRLTVQQYGTYDGRISWPIVFESAEYQDQCGRIDQLYAAHTRDGGGMNTRYYSTIQSELETLQKQLVSNVKKINTEQYMYARKFLKSLQYEARYPVGS